MSEQDFVTEDLGDDAEEYDYSRITPRYSVLDPESMTSETVCGVDERVRVTGTTTLPFKAICKLYMKSPSGGNYVGTGWLTHGNKLYTAAHCVYDRKAGGWMTSITVVPGKSGNNEPYGRYRSASLMALKGYIDSGNPRWDMGAIKLDRATNVGEFITPSLADPGMGAVCGYPADRDTGIFQYRMTDTISKDGGQFRYMLDTFGGQSGSPLLRNRTTGVGIHNYGGCPNSASDLFQGFIDYVNGW